MRWWILASSARSARQRRQVSCTGCRARQAGQRKLSPAVAARASDDDLNSAPGILLLPNVEQHVIEFITGLTSGVSILGIDSGFESLGELSNLACVFALDFA
ncbi:hypothetical protein CA85_19550 [Allorhodopirellula solitaria]|uniref:Uncharacterized protein n=1 Tax=Allorhodopirellula solitaria TaxID=2527987 RepID=A0A5C5XX45_9BACT|nr:hypothetical protein CA85_19550 [Allorhodopirellula solitaria]